MKTTRTRNRNHTRQTTSALIHVLEEVYSEIRQRHPDAAPAVFVTYYSDTKRGHIWFDAWTRTDTSKQLDEIHINSALFSEGPESVLQTMLHEAAHSINRTRGIKDTSRGVVYHNRRFQMTAEEVGLVTEKDPTYGCLTPGLAPGTADRFKPALALLKTVVIAQQWFSPGSGAGKDDDQQDGDTTQGGDDDQKKTNRQIKAVCQCQPARIIRAARKTLEIAPILCAACLQPFEISES
jgi:hypothetical protein